MRRAGNRVVWGLLRASGPQVAQVHGGWRPQQRFLSVEAVPRNLVIIGSGPAAHTAAIYAARAELQPLLFEGTFANGVAAGGQLTTTTEVENFPGFPKGVDGFELTQLFRGQSVNCGAEIRSKTVVKVDLHAGPPFRVITSDEIVPTKALIIATGAVAKRLEFPGSGAGPEGFWMRGISACAVCDGAAPPFRNKPLVVIGGGDSAMEEALFLTKFASRVFIVHRRGELRASKVMQRRAMANPKIEFVFNHIPVKAEGKERLEGVMVAHVESGERRLLEASGLFFAIGHKPATEFLEGQLDLDGEGYIKTTAGRTKTSVEGVFACGDVQDKEWRQAITAAGTGCMAALEVEEFLGEQQ